MRGHFWASDLFYYFLFWLRMRAFVDVSCARKLMNHFWRRMVCRMAKKWWRNDAWVVGRGGGETPVAKCWLVLATRKRSECECECECSKSEVTFFISPIHLAFVVDHKMMGLLLGCNLLIIDGWKKPLLYRQLGWLSKCNFLLVARPSLDLYLLQ